MNVRHGMLAGTLMLVFCLSVAHSSVQRILISEEIDDDHIIVLTEKGQRLLLAKWTVRLSPLIFEGKYLIAEVSPLWVTIYFDDREPIKWSVEETLGFVGDEGRRNESAGQSSTTTKPGCYETYIDKPTPYNGNGGELILLADGTIWEEASYQYLYLYEYNPKVIVCPSQGKMILGSHVFQIIQQR